MAKDCPDKGKDTRRPIKAIEDGQIASITASSLNGFFVVDNEGFQNVAVRGRHRVKPGPTRPTPTKATVADFFTQNNFDALADNKVDDDPVYVPKDGISKGVHAKRSQATTVGGLRESLKQKVGSQNVAVQSPQTNMLVKDCGIKTEHEEKVGSQEHLCSELQNKLKACIAKHPQP